MSLKRWVFGGALASGALLAACSGDGSPAADGPSIRDDAGAVAVTSDDTSSDSSPRDAGTNSERADAARKDDTPPPASIQLDVPLVLQKPELPRGCEVTSLAMLLKFAGVNADKMTLAKEIEKVAYKTNGLFGNPNVGFVGDMYTFANPGYGAYHEPVERLAEKYLPGRIVKLTGQSFDDIVQQHVGRKRPVWIITNATFGKLPASSFTTWNTAQGTVQITWEEHSVVITGYDASSIFINDPLAGKNVKHARTAFREAWEQMGKQALTYVAP